MAHPVAQISTQKTTMSAAAAYHRCFSCRACERILRDKDLLRSLCEEDYMPEARICPEVDVPALNRPQVSKILVQRTRSTNLASQPSNASCQGSEDPYIQHAAEIIDGSAQWLQDEPRSLMEILLHLFRSQVRSMKDAAMMGEIVNPLMWEAGYSPSDNTLDTTWTWAARS